MQDGCNQVARPNARASFQAIGQARNHIFWERIRRVHHAVGLADLSSVNVFDSHSSVSRPRPRRTQHQLATWEKKAQPNVWLHLQHKQANTHLCIFVVNIHLCCIMGTIFRSGVTRQNRQQHQTEQRHMNLVKMANISNFDGWLSRDIREWWSTDKDEHYVVLSTCDNCKFFCF